MTNTATVHSPDFRTYPPVTEMDSRGRLVEMTLCEELVDGRWEPFYSINPITAA